MTAKDFGGAPPASANENRRLEMKVESTLLVKTHAISSDNLNHVSHRHAEWVRNGQILLLKNRRLKFGEQ